MPETATKSSGRNKERKLFGRNLKGLPWCLESLVLRGNNLNEVRKKYFSQNISHIVRKEIS